MYADFFLRKLLYSGQSNLKCCPKRVKRNGGMYTLMQLLTNSPSLMELGENRHRAPPPPLDALFCARLTPTGHAQRTALLAKSVARWLKRPEEEAQAEVHRCTGSCYDPTVVEVLLQIL